MEEMDLKEILNMFWSKKIPIIAIILIFITIGSIYTTQFTTAKYSSSTTLVLASSGDIQADNNTTITATDITINAKLVSTYSELIKSKNILREVIINLQIQRTEEELRKNIKVKAINNTELIEIMVEDKEPIVAAQIANEIAKEFTEKVKEIYNINNVQVVDEAEISSIPSNINHVKDIVSFIGIGIIIALLYVFIASTLDTTIKTTEDIEKMFKIPVLVTIPKIDKLNSERKHKRE